MIIYTMLNLKGFMSGVIFDMVILKCKHSCTDSSSPVVSDFAFVSCRGLALIHKLSIPADGCYRNGISEYIFLMILGIRDLCCTISSLIN